MRPLDASALTRPLFTDQDFTPTKFDTAEEKALFANKLCDFIAADFKLKLFTEKLYRRLSNCFGMIAHYSRNGFMGVYFDATDGKIAFLDDILRYHCYGDPDYTFSDVERAIKKRLRACDLLSAYRVLRAAEIDAAERATLARLRAKYEGAPEPAPVVMPILAPAANARRTSHQSDREQPNLL